MGWSEGEVQFSSATPATSDLDLDAVNDKLITQFSQHSDLFEA